MSSTLLSTLIVINSFNSYSNPQKVFVIIIPIFFFKSITPVLSLPDAKSWLIGKDPDAGKD